MCPLTYRSSLLLLSLLISLPSCLHYITKNGSLAPGTDPTQGASKEVQEKEKDLLLGIKAVLQKFIHDKPDLQFRALYAVQVFCHGAKFPKGLNFVPIDLYIWVLGRDFSWALLYKG